MTSSEFEVQSHRNDTKPKGNLFVNIIIFILLMVFVQTPTILALSIMGLSVKGSDTSLIVGLSIGFVLLSVLAIWLTRKYYLSHTYEDVKSHQLTTHDIGVNILCFLGLRGAVALFTLIMTVIYGDSSSANDDALLSNVLGIDTMDLNIVIALILFFTSITFIAPYLEEVTFRGIFKETLFSKSAFWLPMLLSSAIFSINHASNNIVGFLMYMTMGAILYLVYRRRGSIKDSIMVHMLNNGMASVTIIAMLIMQ